MNLLALPRSAAGRFLIVCALAFLISVSLKLNGSSIFMWQQKLRDYDTRSESLLLSTPKGTRSDEWLAWTPGLLSQAAQTPSFPIANPSLGAGDTPLIYNLPVRYYTTFFRPQYWGFFVFDVETGYSIYWSCKIFGLLISFFFLLQLLTRGHFGISLFGTLWLFLSSYIQWWFSCPPMLPEMLTTWALCVLSAVQIFKADHLWKRAAWSAGLVFNGINFILCLYPAFQIPLVYLGILITVALLWENRAAQTQRSFLQRFAWLGAATVVLVALLIPFFQEILPTLQIVANTSYPGHRRRSGGDLNVMELFSEMLNPFATTERFPESYESLNVAANFYPIWLVALAVAGVIVYRAKSVRPVLLAILTAIVLFGTFALVRLPEWFCRITLLGFCTEARMLLVIGLAGILFTSVVIHELISRKIRLGLGVGLTMATTLVLALAGYFYAAHQGSPKFLSIGNLSFLVAVNAALIVLFVFAPYRGFCPALVGIFACTNLFVNPLMSGLSPLLGATPRKVVQRLQQSHPEAKWVVFGSHSASEFVMSAGGNLLSGLKIVPDLAFYRMIDPEGKAVDYYNRYSFAAFIPNPLQDQVQIIPREFPSHVVLIHPNHAALKQENVRFFVFEVELADPATIQLKSVAAFPRSRLFFYETARSL